MKLDEKYMQIAIDLAGKFSNISFPNPPVACLVVECDKNYENDEIVGSGYTFDGGRPHAESQALRDIIFKKKKKYICFCTLEPCCHQGRSESCISLIKKTPIKEVVISLIDPDKRVNGNGMKALIKSGIEVRTGILKSKAMKLYEGYFLNRLRKRPKIILKIATSLDGNINSNITTKPITNNFSRKFVHYLRCESDGILIGGNTLAEDNPKLDCRINGLEKYSPIRFILSNSFDYKKKFKIFKIKNSKTIIFHSSAELFNKNKERTKFDNVFYNFLTRKENNLKTILRKISLLGVSNLLVEGGSKIFGSFLNEGFVDELFIFRSNHFIGQKGLNAIQSKKNFVQKKIKFKLKKLKFLNDDHLEIFQNDNHIKLMNEFLKKY